MQAIRSQFCSRLRGACVSRRNLFQRAHLLGGYRYALGHTHLCAALQGFVKLCLTLCAVSSRKPFDYLPDRLGSLLHPPRFPLKLFIKLGCRIKGHPGDDADVIRLGLVVRPDRAEFLASTHL